MAIKNTLITLGVRLSVLRDFREKKRSGEASKRRYDKQIERVRDYHIFLPLLTSYSADIFAE